MALRACLMVFITSMALERQKKPRILAEWYRIGDGEDPNNRTLYIGNLWSSNFSVYRNFEMDNDEKCPHREHIISLKKPPYHGCNNVEREERRDGRVMMILPACRWMHGRRVDSADGEGDTLWLEMGYAIG